MEELLSKVKANLILEHSADDELLKGYITAAVSYAESYQRLLRRQHQCGAAGVEHGQPSLTA